MVLLGTVDNMGNVSDIEEVVLDDCRKETASASGTVFGRKEKTSSGRMVLSRRKTAERKETTLTSERMVFDRKETAERKPLSQIGNKQLRRNETASASKPKPNRRLTSEVVCGSRSSGGNVVYDQEDVLARIRKSDQKRAKQRRRLDRKLNGTEAEWKRETRQLAQERMQH